MMMPASWVPPELLASGLFPPPWLWKVPWEVYVVLRTPVQAEAGQTSNQTPPERMLLKHAEPALAVATAMALATAVEVTGHAS